MSENLNQKKITSPEALEQIVLDFGFLPFFRNEQRIFQQMLLLAPDAEDDEIRKMVG